MKNKTTQWTVNAVWLIALIALIVLLIHKSHTSEQIEYRHIRSIELVEKGISLGLTEQIEREIHTYKAKRRTDPEALPRLNGRLTILIEDALDLKYSRTNTVTSEEVYDRQY